MSGTSITIAEPQSDISNLVFYGVDGNECEEFVVSIRRFAFTEGKARHDNWMLDLATISLRGKALRWHASLEKSIKQDWDLFVQALFEKSILRAPYPRPARPVSNSASPSPLVSAREGPRIGKLHLVGANFPGTDYIASNATEVKDFHGIPVRCQQITFGPTQADVVRLIQVDDCIGFYLITLERWLGITWDDETGVGVVSPAYTSAKSPTPFAATPRDYYDSQRVRDSASQIWRIDAERTLSATCNSLGVSTADGPPSWMTTVAVHMIDKTMYFVGDFDDFVKEAPHLYYEARLVFEPVDF